MWEHLQPSFEILSRVSSDRKKTDRALTGNGNDGNAAGDGSKDGNKNGDGMNLSLSTALQIINDFIGNKFGNGNNM